MERADLRCIKVKGDLAVRSGLNYARLEGDWYRPEEIFKADSHGWPGDWEGRVILALTMLEQSTHRTSAYLDEIVSILPSHLNAKGYLGPIMPEGTFDEQHFSGQSWMLRALSAYYHYKDDPRVLTILEGMVKNFLMPVKGSYTLYPIEPGERFKAKTPWVLSHLQTKTKHHAETSDAGCAFMMIDGATAAYKILREPALRELIDEMIGRYMEADLEALNIQTHATLSAVRGILRFYKLTGEKRYLDMALQRYALYRSSAWTECYGNFNWFGAPRWTESCAIIDSFIVAVKMWEHTGDVSFLNDSHLIYYNALSHGNRINGSFGTDRCCGALETEDNLFLTPVNYETYWCCTMRGGEGFARAIGYCYFVDGDTVTFPFYHSFETVLLEENGPITFEMVSKYPFRDSVEIIIKHSELNAPCCFRLFVPEWAGNVRLLLNGKVPDGEPCEKTQDSFISLKRVFKTGDIITLNLDIQTRCEQTRFKNCVSGYHKFFYGPMLLGCESEKEINSTDGNRFENYAESRYKSSGIVSISEDAKLTRVDDGVFQVEGTDLRLTSLCNVKNMTREDTLRQVLFKS